MFVDKLIKGKVKKREERNFSSPLFDTGGNKYAFLVTL